MKYCQNYLTAKQKPHSKKKLFYGAPSAWEILKGSRTLSAINTLHTINIFSVQWSTKRYNIVILISMTIHPHHTSISFYCQIIVIIKDIERKFSLHRIFNDKFPSHSLSLPVGAVQSIIFPALCMEKWEMSKRKLIFSCSCRGRILYM